MLHMLIEIVINIFGVFLVILEVVVVVVVVVWVMLVFVVFVSLFLHDRSCDEVLLLLSFFLWSEFHELPLLV